MYIKSKEIDLRLVWGVTLGHQHWFLLMILLQTDRVAPDMLPHSLWPQFHLHVRGLGLGP